MYGKVIICYILNPGIFKTGNFKLGPLVYILPYFSYDQKLTLKNDFTRTKNLTTTKLKKKKVKCTSNLRKYIH